MGWDGNGTSVSLVMSLTVERSMGGRPPGPGSTVGRLAFHCGHGPSTTETVRVLRSRIISQLTHHRD